MNRCLSLSFPTPNTGRNRITLVGHSSGAHLVHNAVVGLAVRACGATNARANHDHDRQAAASVTATATTTTATTMMVNTNDDGADDDDDGSHHSEEHNNEKQQLTNGFHDTDGGLTGRSHHRHHSNDHGHEMAVTSLHEDVEQDITPSVADELLHRLASVVGLSGVYNIQDHYVVETARGVEWLSAMHRVMGGHQHYHRHSPAHTIMHVPSDCWREGWPTFRLMHGEDDITVPAEASIK